MEINRIFNYKNHIQPIFRPFVDFKISKMNSSHCLNNNSELIVSLTSYDERLEDLKYTLYSLFTQTLMPNKIILWLDETKYSLDMLPKSLNIFRNKGLEICFCKDIGSYTKLIPAIIKYNDKIIVTADDDIYYPKDWLKKLYASYLEDKESIHCHRAHKIKLNISNKQIEPYKTWEKHIGSSNPDFTNFLTGAGGVLYPPNCFNTEVLNENKFIKLAPFADDIWFWAIAVLSGRKIRVVKNNIKTLKTTNIWRQLNLKNAKTLYKTNKAGGNDKQLENILNAYPEIKSKLFLDIKIRLIFDASSLYAANDKSGKRAGIYNVASNILTSFISDKSFEVTLYCNYKYYYFIKSLYPELKIINCRSLIAKICGLLFYNIRLMPHKIKYLIIHILRIIDKIFLFTPTLTNILSNYDIYFSPFEGIPDDVMKSPIKKYQFIHDIIPLLENNTLPPYHWAKQVFKNITPDITYFTNSEYTKKDFLNYFNNISKDNVITTPLGCTIFSKSDIDIYRKYNIPRDKKYILSLCTMGKRKNIDFAAKNVKSFIEKNSLNDLVYVLAGSVWANYKRTLKNLVSSSNIIVTGYVNDEDLPVLYSNALCFVYPSLYEGFGLPVLEAMTYGCPVIVSNRSSLPEICGECGILINPESDEEFISALTKIYYNKDFRLSQIQMGLARATNFSTEKCYNLIKQELCKNGK